MTSPADIEERMRHVETTTAVHESELGSMKEAVHGLTDHLTLLNASVDKLTKYLIVIAIASLLLDNHDPLVQLLSKLPGG